MARRNPNGYGGVTKLSGKRSKPYLAYISEMQAEGILLSPDTQNKLETANNALQKVDTIESASSIYAEALTLLYSDMSKEDFIIMLSDDLEQRRKKRTFKSKQVKKPIGYFKTSAEANIALAEYNKNPYDMDKRKVTFKEVYELAYKDTQIEKKSRASIAAYSSGFQKCESVHKMAMSDIRLIHLQNIVDANSEMSKATIGNILTVCRMVYTYALQHDLTDKDYSAFVKIKDHAEQEEKHPYTREEIQMLWENANWTFDSQRKSILTNEKAVDVLLILIHTGMRIDELLSTKAEDVHLDERYITVRGTKTKNAYRIAPIHKNIIPLLQERLDYGGEYLISTKKGKQVKYINFKSPVYDKLCEDLELNHTIHETRHTFATYTTKMNSTLRSYILGHSTKNITNDIYTHPEVLIPELIAEIDKIEF